jgi:hypothetical protein
LDSGWLRLARGAQVHAHGLAWGAAAGGPTALLQLCDPGGALEAEPAPEELRGAVQAAAHAALLLLGLA